ncbi:phage baseplate protein [Streptomyces mayteni]
MTESLASSADQAHSRRGLLTGGIKLAAGAAVLGGTSLLTVSPAHADVDDTPKFKLEGNGGNPVWRRTLHQPYWAMQSFAYDSVNSQIYFAQHKVGGDNGDLWLSKTDLSGTVLSTMAIHGFGHGSSMGVESAGVGTPPFIWIESHSVNDAGTRIARFRWSDGGELDSTSPTIQNRTPTVSTFAHSPRPAFDSHYGRMLFRYHSGSGSRPWRLALFSQADAVAGRLGDGTRLTERAIPTNQELGLTGDDLFQGITACGRYAYLLFGGTNRTSYLVTLDMNATADSYVEKYPTSAGQSLPGREAQGIAIWRVNGAPRLAFGYSSRDTSTSPDSFEASVFYKSEFI